MGRETQNSKLETRNFFLRCVSCEAQYPADEIDYTCPKCGPLLGTLDVIYDTEYIAKELTRESLSQSSQSSHWRYSPILPIANPDFIQPLAVGWTPLYRSNNLEQEWGLGAIWIKDDGRNPTASFKDRASSVAVVKPGS